MTTPLPSDNRTPIFASIFADAWNSMPSVMHKHYANRPYCTDRHMCHGRMYIYAHPLLRIFSPLMRAMGGIPIANKKDITVSVAFESDPDTPNLHFVRAFHIKPGKPYIFHSTMAPTGGNHVTEIMPFGLCWRSGFSWQNGKVLLSHRGYSLRLFRRFMPLPISWLLGRIHAEEEALSDTRFKMFMEIRHPIFGKIYEYGGEFEMQESPDA